MDDFFSVAVPLNEKEEEVYTKILKSVGLKPFIVEASKYNAGNRYDKKRLAEDIAHIIGQKKSVTLGRWHSIMAFLYNNEDTSSVIFDAHCDAIQIPEAPYFNDGNFLTERKGETHIIGTSIKPLGRESKIKVYPRIKMRQALNRISSENFFLSLDIDVFSRNVTNAHHYPHNGLLERIGGKLFGYDGHLSFEEVLNLSEELIAGKNLLGVNIAGYNPMLEDSDYRTAELLKKYLGSILQIPPIQEVSPP